MTVASREVAPQRKAPEDGQGPGVGTRDDLYGDDRGPLPPLPSPPTHTHTHTSRSSKKSPAGRGQTGRLLCPGPQERDLRRTVQQIVDAVSSVPFLDDPAPQMVEQLLNLTQFFDKLMPGYRSAQDLAL